MFLCNIFGKKTYLLPYISLLEQISNHLTYAILNMQFNIFFLPY